jgi:propanol-preferring alcohol dehydrogenase
MSAPRMRAAVLDAPAPVDTRPLDLREIDVPSPRPDELLVAVEVCGICRTDLHVVEGELPQRRRPLVPGHQIVGRVRAAAADGSGPAVGTRVGVAWLGRTCGACRFCTSGRENLCLDPQLTGWTRDGGFAELATAPARFVYPLPAELSPELAAPLLCAGIIGYRCLRCTGLEARGFQGARLGIYGFGAAGHIAIQIARARGARVFVCTRDQTRHQALARELGAEWVGGQAERPPEALDAAIVFAPAGELVPAALKALDRGGTLVLGGIHMSPIPEMEYADLYHERSIRSVANNTREDGHALLAEAARVGVRTHVQTYPLAAVNEALIDLRHDAIRGAGVIVVG